MYSTLTFNFKVNKFCKINKDEILQKNTTN